MSACYHTLATQLPTTAEMLQKAAQLDCPEIASGHRERGGKHTAAIFNTGGVSRNG